MLRVEVVPWSIASTWVGPATLLRSLQIWLRLATAHGATLARTPCARTSQRPLLVIKIDTARLGLLLQGCDEDMKEFRCRGDASGFNERVATCLPQANAWL